ncbi:hypothetical protein GCM10011518_34280 [Flavobacterium limi]|uniref:Uncharacterized protein n=1 Tax=Flavobacterium limi TaxID=2045105 RepID=A0ABQ1UMY1_9FLAO|nr:hypothetical protein GCM10011518_34280 [Flavobacterium limi]
MAFLPKIIMAAMPKPTAGKKGAMFVSGINANPDALAIMTYKIAVTIVIFIFEFKKGTL